MKATHNSMDPDSLRNQFLGFFGERHHALVASDSLVPAGDPTLLFTTAGMVQFKSLYAGAPLPYPRAVSVQKCLRAGGKGSDLERVGRTLRHHTFFEMLGNFSFGDYFKREAIDYALGFILDILKMDRGRLWVSVFEDDEDARDLWIKAGFPAERIVSLGKDDNFWGPAGEEGACGPCSEIYYDLGVDRSCGSSSCAVGCDCERYLEFWNLVFPQFYQEPDGRRRPLERRGVDTGMGLERLAFLMDPEASDNYQTLLFRPLIDILKGIAPVAYRDGAPHYHVVVDHLRALTFAIGDGVLPANEGRGYVIRRILRRALRFGRRLGLDKPFLHACVPQVVHQFKGAYPELAKAASSIQQVIRDEEERFAATLDRGLVHLEEALREARSRALPQLSGETCFRLYDTYGLPWEVIAEEAADQNVPLGEGEFQALMASQKQRGKASWKGTKFTLPVVEGILGDVMTATRFTGYDECETEARVLALIQEDSAVDELTGGADGLFIVDQSVCYAESGGQVGDRGWFRTITAAGDILDVQKTKNDVFLHAVRVREGTLKKGDKVHLGFDPETRRETRKHHTATHMLQAVLREILGKHVRQAGSYVGPDRLRFDFSHPGRLSPHEIELVESRMNEWILRDEPLQVAEVPLEEAKRQENILANFGDKYGDRVRVLAVGEGSRELCGGTHVNRTGEIGGFKIVNEASVSAGVRRLEAVTGKTFIQRQQELSQLVQSLGQELKVPMDGILKKVQAQGLKIRELEKKISQVLAGGNASREATVDLSFQEGEIPVCIRGYEALSDKDLMSILDGLKSHHPRAAYFLGSVTDGKIIYTAACRGLPELHCGKWLSQAAALAGGKGGGRVDLARGGGIDPAQFEASLQEAKRFAQAVWSR